MNAIDLLKQDHNFVESLFQKIESTPPSRHAATIKKIKEELDTHANGEEKIFYPALRAKGNKELQDITMEGIEEHGQIKKFLKEIARSTSTEKREAKLKVLIEDTRHHVKEEEGEMFSLVEDQFSSEELEALGDRLEAEKKKFQKAKGISGRREEAKGPMAGILDKAKEFVAGLTGGGDSGQEKASSGGRKSSGSNASSGKSSGSAKAASGSGKTSKGSAGSGTSSKAPSGTGNSGNASSPSGKAAKASGGSGKSAKASSGSAGGRKAASSGNGGGGSKKSTGGSGNGGSSKGSKSGSAGAKSGGKSSGSQKSGSGSRSKASSK